jgi:hypothetical protein
VGQPPITLPKPIVFLGFVVYRDVFFPDTKIHLTEFCKRLTQVNVKFEGTPSDKPIPRTIPRFTPLGFFFEGCAQHNCADEYCGSDYEKAERALK